METAPQRRHAIPQWIRWTALLWLVIWTVTYWRYWGPTTFLFFCDIAVILTCMGLATGSALLLSSQAISSLLIDLAWAADAGWRFTTGHPLTGGTEYLFDATYPLWVRLISLFHVLLPFLLLWAVNRTGYDPRGWKLQSAIALVVFVACRFTPPEKNINFAFRDPFFHRQHGPAALHVALTFVVLVIAVYLPTHAVLGRLFSPAATAHDVRTP
jgi:hypothetical protein